MEFQNSPCDRTSRILHDDLNVQLQWERFAFVRCVYFSSQGGVYERTGLGFRVFDFFFLF